MHVDFDDHSRDGGVRLSREIEDTVYRLVQESLNNVARHGKTDSARVDVTEDNEMLRVRVADKGNGFDPRVRTEGFGLTGMRERVTLAGGTLEVQSAPGKGTTIVASVPARRRDEGTEQPNALSA
jgi:two-component system sensor histidine kinase UhpB